MLKALFYPAGTKEKPIKFDSLYIPYIYREIYFEGVYTDILNNDKPMTILDVGSNIGVTVQHFREKAKKVYAIEPSSTHFEALKKNKEFNEWDNVEIFQMAVADKDGEMDIHYNDNNLTCNSLTLDYGGKTEKVKTIRFDTFMNDNKIDVIDFCKFDVEGAEDMILRSEGFKNVCERVKSIMVEFHFPSWMELVQYMTTLGYTPRRYQSSAIIVLFTR